MHTSVNRWRKKKPNITGLLPNLSISGERKINPKRAPAPLNVSANSAWKLLSQTRSHWKSKLWNLHIKIFFILKGIRDGGLVDQPRSQGRPQDLILVASDSVSVSAAHVSVSVLVSDVPALSTGSREPASVSRPASRPNLDASVSVLVSATHVSVSVLVSEVPASTTTLVRTTDCH